MKITYFFELVEKANELKNFVGENLKIKVTVSLNDNVIGTVYTIEQFWKLIGNDIKEIILDTEIQKTISVREFKIIFTKNEEKNIIKLFVE